jgi:hypothetical protein
MPNNVERTPIQTAWINYVRSVRLLLVPQADDRPLDQYLSFKNAVLALVESEQFLNELNANWPPKGRPPAALLTGAGEALILELQAFPLAMEVAQASERAEEKKAWWKRMLDRASTTTGSVKDLLENLPGYAKSALTLFRELLDLFRAKD